MKFSSVITLSSSRTADPASAGIDRFVGLEHIEPENLHIRSWGLVADGTTFTNTFKRGQVLFGKRRAYQRKVAVADFDGVCSSDIYVFESKDPKVLLPELVPFICQSEGFYDYAVKTSAGSLSPRTNWTHLANYEFPLPPVDEQRRIADLLWAADDSIEKNKMALEAIEQLATAAFNDYLGGGTTNKSVQTSMYFGAIPSSWTEKEMSELCLNITDGEHITPKKIDKGIYLLSAKNIQDGSFDLNDVDFTNDEAYKKFTQRIHPEVGDVLITCSGTIGRVCRIQEEFPFVLVRSVAIVKPNKELIHPEFLELCLRSGYLQRQMKTRTNQLAQGNLFQGSIKKLVIPTPPKIEQEKIVETMRLVKNSISLMSQHLENSAALKKSLLNKFLN